MYFSLEDNRSRVYGLFRTQDVDNNRHVRERFNTLIQYSDIKNCAYHINVDTDESHEQQPWKETVDELATAIKYKIGKYTHIRMPKNLDGCTDAASLKAKGWNISHEFYAHRI